MELTTKQKTKKDWGTFKDSLRAPIHSWFTYPAGFSYKAVESSLRNEDLHLGKSVIYDPFMGSGTTNIVAKYLGYNSIGVEAHPFVHKITETKIFWELNSNEAQNFLNKIHDIENNLPSEEEIILENKKNYPELVVKCFLPSSLYKLHKIKISIDTHPASLETKRFLQTALICTLRDVSIAATGWPYIAPKKIKITSMSKNVTSTYVKKANQMLHDISCVKELASTIKTSHKIILGNSKKTSIPKESVDYIFTSPPYLNNFDYADRTRLEMYFMGEAKNWEDISKQVRTKLMTSATTQISRSDKKYEINTEIKKTAPEIYSFLSDAKTKLALLRTTKGGKKSYDLLVSGYFNDMFEILKDNFRVLKKGSRAVYILGDSAPYGVHIPTDLLIGKLGVALGFKKYSIEVLRERGGKWALNPQRHNVALRESIVILEK